jgi:hypothetical protein
MIRGKREDTEGVREAEFIVLDFIKSTPNATVPEIARLIDDVGADLNYIANVMGVDPAVARQAYDQVITDAPPIEQVIEKQVQSEPITPPTRPLDKVIDTSRPAFKQEDINRAVGELSSGAKTPEQVAQEYGVSVDYVNNNLGRIQNQVFDDLLSGATTAQQVADQYGLGLDFVNSAFDRMRQERGLIPETPTYDPPPPPVVSPPVTTVPDAVDPNLLRNAQTGGMAGAQLPVGLAAAEQAALGGAGRATGLLGTTAGAAGRELTAGTLGGIGALRGGIGQARQDIMQGTQTGIGALQQALGGARADIESGFAGGRADIQQALAQSRGDIQSGFGRAEAMFDPYAQAGGQALQQQLALSGALGPEAFQQAYQESPQMQFLREQGERAALRTAAARGGLGGGRVMQELTRYGTGLASQDLQNQIANLQALSAQGLGARGSAANIATGGAQQLSGLAAGAGQNLANISTGQAQQLANLGVLGGTSGLQAATQQGTQLANLAQQLGTTEADLLTGLGAGRSNIALGIGTRAADLAAQTGLNVAGMRTRAGEQLAGQFGTAASQLADLQQAQGAGTASMIGAQTNYMNQLQQAAAAGDAAAQTELAVLQANINQGIASNLAGVPAAQFVPPPNAAGSILQGAALGYEFGQGLTPSTQPQTTYPVSNMTQMTGTAPAGYQAYNPFGISRIT